MLILPESYRVFEPEMQPFLSVINQFIEGKNHNFFPPENLIFSALKLTPLEKVKVVILGQDPYHDDRQACGLAFAVPESEPLPPSLKNIFKELKSDLGIENSTGDLSEWAKRGVLLLNTVLTVEPHRPLSHRNCGWEVLTDALISGISREKEHAVFVLWGNQAGRKAELIDTQKHMIISSAHPSPLSAARGFFGSRPFSKINAALTGFGLEPVDWQIKNRNELFQL